MISNVVCKTVPLIYSSVNVIISALIFVFQLAIKVHALAVQFCRDLYYMADANEYHSLNVGPSCLLNHLIRPLKYCTVLTRYPAATL